jgi:2-polyprenyl-3-methyl-5-hydroxy-6-metoxy-1,4-benzoquinol methylase
MERIKNSGNEVIGIEISENAIRKSREKGFLVYDFSLENDWSQKISEDFDIIFGGEIIEHIFDTDNFLKNIRNLLKKMGS